MRRRGRFIFVLLTLLLLIVGTWGLVWRLRYPKMPDVATVDLKEAVEFLATEDFLRLTRSDRRQYMKVLADRHRDLPFPELVRRLIDPQQRDLNRRIGDNLRRVNEDEQLGAPILEVFLDKFYQLTPVERQQYLLTIAVAQQARINQGGDSRLASLRDPQKFNQEMASFMSRTSPQLQAKMGQFMLDLKRTRSIMGMKDPV